MLFSDNVRAEVRFPSGEAHAPLSFPLYLSAYLERTAERQEYISKAEGHYQERILLQTRGHTSL